MALSIPPTSPVAQMFGRYLKAWQNDLDAWTKWCKGGEEERKTLQATGGLVAQAAVAPRGAINPTLSDAPRLPDPPGLSPQAADRLQALERRSAKCAKVIAELERVIALLRKAQQTGAWSGQVFVVRAEKKFTSRILARVSRGESVDVLGISGGWWQVRTSTGIVGWVASADAEPKLPVHLGGPGGIPAPGSARRPASPDEPGGRSEVGEGGRG